MAAIGTFKKTASNEFTGEIVTLSLQAKGVRIVADTRATGENAPSHRVLVGRAEIGAAWSKRSAEGRDYLGLKLDDPSFTAPIYANLFADEDGEGLSLIWSRPSGTPQRLTRSPLQCPGVRAGKDSRKVAFRAESCRPATLYKAIKSELFPGSNEMNAQDEPVLSTHCALSLC